MKPKTHLIPAALVAALLLLCLATPAAAFSGAGSGTESDPYIISDANDYISFRESVASNTYWELSNDIDLSSISSLPSTSTSLLNVHFNGNGYKLHSGSITSTSRDFSLIFDGAYQYSISNLWLEDIHLSATTQTASNYGHSHVALIASTLGRGSSIDTIYITDCTMAVTVGSVISSSSYFVAGVFGEGSTYGSTSSTGGSTVSNVFIDGLDITTNGNSKLRAALFGINLYGSSSGGGQKNYGSNIICVDSTLTINGDSEYNNYGVLLSDVGGASSSNAAYFSNAVLLSSKLISTGSDGFVRIAHSSNDGLSNSYALSSFLINGDTVSGSLENGQDITTTQATSQSFYADSVGLDFSNTWVWDANYAWNDANGITYHGLPRLQAFQISVPPTIFAISATPATGGQLTEYTLSVTATTEAAGGIASYQWYYSTNSGQTWQPISGATAATYVWTPGTSISGAVLLKCYITGADGGTVDSYEAGYTNIQITVITAPAISQISVSRPLQKVNTPTTLTAIFADTQTATYQWYYSTNSGTTWQAISGATQTTAEYTPTTTGTHQIKIIATNQYGESSELSTSFTVLPTYTPTEITQTTFDTSIDTTAKYQGAQQFTLSAELKALNYYTPNLAHLAHDNALYYLDSAEKEVIPVSQTTGGTISAAYVGQHTGIITDTAGNTAIYSYDTNDWQYIEQNSAQIIASTSAYAATVSGGTLRIYNLNGNLVASTTTTAANLAGNDATNIFASYSDKTLTYYWYQNGEIKTASQTLAHTITELHQISNTANWIVSTSANTYIISISDDGSYELLSTTDTDTPLIHTQATNINVLIGVAAPNEIFIVGADGETDGTYVTGSTLLDTSIAKATGLYAITGGEDRQAYILAKSTSSTWQLLQTVTFGDNIDYSQISTTGTYAAVSTGLKLYLLEAVDISANTYLLQGVIIGSSGSVWANKPFTINGDNLRTDAAGRFIYSIQPATLYTIITDTTTTEYTATNAALQTIAIKLKPNPFAQSVSYSTDYNADTRNFEMIYTDIRDMTSSVTWIIRETGNQTIVSKQTVQAGQTAYWEVPLDKSFTSYQISMIADRQGANVENVWIITPEGKNPINIPGLDDTGRNIIFGAVLMIFGGLFGVMHSTKGAIITVAFAGVLTYLGLLTIPWPIIMIAGTLAVLAALAKGSGGS